MHAADAHTLPVCEINSEFDSRQPTSYNQNHVIYSDSKRTGGQ